MCVKEGKSDWRLREREIVCVRLRERESVCEHGIEGDIARE